VEGGGLRGIRDSAYLGSRNLEGSFEDVEVPGRGTGWTNGKQGGLRKGRHGGTTKGKSDFESGM